MVPQMTGMDLYLSMLSRAVRTLSSSLHLERAVADGRRMLEKPVEAGRATTMTGSV